MDLPEFSALNQRLMPFRALLEADLNSMYRSWVVRIWLGLMAAQGLFYIAVSSADGTLASETLASLLATYTFIWSTAAILVSSGAVASEAGVVADSILSKAVTRYEYILAKLGARLITVIGLYLLIALPAAYAIPRYAQDDVTRAGVLWGITVIGMTLVLLTSIAVTFSTIFNRTLVTVVVVWFLWYMAGGIFALLDLDYLSPLAIADNLVDTLQGDFSTRDQLRNIAGFGIPSIGFSSLAVAYFNRKDL